MESKNEKIHFWHVNCAHAIDFCKDSPKIEEAGLPTMLYSFRNEFWETQGCKTYSEHAFETFFNTKLNENCLNTPTLCSSVMNMTLKEHKAKNHTDIRDLYLQEDKKGKDLEKEWETVSQNIQRQWNEERSRFVIELRNSDDRLKIYKLLMEKMHSESYEEMEGATQQLVIDMREKYM